MTRARLSYELGTILDRQGNYDGAMAAFLEAKRLLRPAAEPPLKTLEGIQARVQEMETSISPAFFDRWRDAHAALGPARRLAVLCGHPRSGTTLLEQLLDSHQEIVAAEETHLLHDEAYLPLTRGISPDVPVMEMLDAAAVDALEKSRRDYFQFAELFLGQAIAGRLLIDKNPALNVLIPAVARIFPEARLLVAIRDPRDVCLSCFMQPLPLNPVSSAYLTLEGTVRQFVSVMGFWRSLAPMLKNDWIEVRYEDLVGDLEATGPARSRIPRCPLERRRPALPRARSNQVAPIEKLRGCHTTSLSQSGRTMAQLRKIPGTMDGATRTLRRGLWLY